MRYSALYKTNFGLLFLILFTGLNDYCMAKSGFKATEYIVRKINIEGNESFSKRKLKRQLNLKEKRLTRKSSTFTRRLLELDRILLETIYVKNGYLNCTVRDSFKVNKGAEVDLFYYITEGRQFYLKDITVSGQEFLSEERILHLLEHKISKPYNPILIGNGIKKIIVEYANKGKPLAIVYDSLDVNEGIHLFIKIRENPTMRIGDVKIVNNNFVKEKLIRREIAIKPGDLYSQEKVELSKKHIFETGLFSSVNIRLVDIDTLNSKLSLLVDVRELNMRYLGFDFGFGQDRGISSGSEPYTSIEIEGEWLHRNIFKRGSRLSTKLSNSLNLTNIFTRPKTLAEIVCVEPWLWGFRSSTSFRLFMDNQVLSEQEITRYGGDVALIYQPDKRFYLRTGLEIKGIRFQVEQDTIDARDRERAITFNLRRDHRDNFLYPTKGTVFTLTGKVVPKILRATQYYYKFETSFSQYINLFGSLVFAYRGKLGLMDTFYGDETPDYEKFYLGGGTSMRAWKDMKFHPSSGGDFKFLTNAEIRFPLFWILGGEIFIDGGSLVFGNKIRWDAGMGLTITTPLGPIRVDYAEMLNPKVGEDNLWQIQFSIPYAF